VARFNQETAGLAMLAVAEVPQVMSAFLPSPATARMGFNEGEDHLERIRYLRRGEIIGSAVSLTLALAITLITRPAVGDAAWGPFIGATVVLAVFLWEYERAIRAALKDAGGHAEPTPEAY
jgi:hypothetical protein